jgi:hypothetical protein
MSYFQQMQMLDFFNENGVTHVNLSVLSCARDGNRKMKGDARARDRDEAVRSLAWAWNENRNGGEVYVRPARFLPDGKPAAWPMIFFDDVPLEIVPKIKKSALVIETSPKNFHVWMPLSRPLGENERRAEQVRIQPLLKSDPASTSGEHFGRLPGFLNHKRNRVMVRILKKVDGPLLVPSPAPGPAPTAPYSPPLKGGARVSDSSPRLTGSGASESEREFGYLIGRLGWFKAHGIPLNLEIARLKKRLVEQAERRGKRNPSEYARRSVEAALREIQGI